MSSRVLLEIGHLPLSGAVAPSVFVGFFEIQQVGFHAQTSGIATSAPVLPTTRWQGTTMAIGLRLLAMPTARQAVGRPICAAIWP